jgi:hypothetical protein
LNFALKYISWELNVSINLIGIRLCRQTSHTYKNILIYKFQNSCLKLLQNCHYPPINVFIYKQKLYILLNIDIIPKLINTPEKKQISFYNKTITSTHVLQIINNTLLETFPFQINIYTSYTYIQDKSKSVASNMIGQYRPPSMTNQPILHIFISSNLKGDQIFMHQLEINDDSIFYPPSIYSNKHFTEGKKINFPLSRETDQPKNNLHCICDHPKTENYFPPRKYKNLGNPKNKQAMTYHNLFFIFSAYSFSQILFDRKFRLVFIDIKL